MFNNAPLGPEWPDGTDRVILSTVDSTMAEAARRAEGITRPVWIMAQHQAAGRGRQGKAWVTPPGNLSATYLFRPNCAPAEAAKRSFLAANALYQALALFVEPEKLSLKWPNDVLLSGGKVAGILLESSGVGGQVDWLSVGIGVNLLHVPQGVTDAAFAPVSVKSTGGDTVTPEDFLTKLASAYATQEKKLRIMGFDRIREDWLKNAAR
ncbi:MAG: biotin--[acetyl-CoA-carboxylase] ligase, partial [Pseudomonadota bacterium]